MNLEYRLDDEAGGYPALWHYSALLVAEVVSRMTCEFFVKDACTYRVTMTVKDPSGNIVIYLIKEAFPQEANEKFYDFIGFEINEVSETGQSVLLESKYLFSHEEAMDVLHCDMIFVKKEGRYLEFALDSREIDEDRKCYVYYGKFTGNEF